MANMNQITLIGRVGRKDTKTFQNGNTIVEIRLATSEKYKAKDGTTKEDTQWHTAVYSGTLAGIADKYINKGDLVFVQGRMTYRAYTDKNNIEKIAPEVRVLTMQLLPQGNGTPSTPSTPSAPVDDMPF